MLSDQIMHVFRVSFALNYFVQCPIYMVSLSVDGEGVIERNYWTF